MHRFQSGDGPAPPEHCKTSLNAGEELVEICSSRAAPSDSNPERLRTRRQYLWSVLGVPRVSGYQVQVQAAAQFHCRDHISAQKCVNTTDMMQVKATGQCQTQSCSYCGQGGNPLDHWDEPVVFRCLWRRWGVRGGAAVWQRVDSPALIVTWNKPKAIRNREHLPCSGSKPLLTQFRAQIQQPELLNTVM